MYCVSPLVCSDWSDGIQSKRRQVGSATNKTATRRNGDNLIGDNSVISATDKIKMAKKQQVKTATTIEEEEGREKKRREEPRREDKESLINEHNEVINN